MATSSTVASERWKVGWAIHEWRTSRLQHRSLTGWQVDRGRNGRWPSGSVERGEPRKSERVQRTWQRSGVRGRYLTRLWVAAVKISPDGQFISTAMWKGEPVLIYDSRDGRLFSDSLIGVGLPCN